MDWAIGWEKGRIDLINHILRTNAKAYQDMPDWLTKALLVEKAKSEASIKEMVDEQE